VYTAFETASAGPLYVALMVESAVAAIADDAVVSIAVIVNVMQSIRKRVCRMPVRPIPSRHALARA
jgi:hypothetical protein